MTTATVDFLGPEMAGALIDGIDHKHFFSVRFIKRTNGERRHMICRKGVKKGVNGAGMKYDPRSRDLRVVWDAQKKDFRMINLNTIYEVRAMGETLKVVHSV